MPQQHHVEKIRQAVARILMAVGRSAPRRLWIVVTLALVIGSTGQTSPAQAAPAGVPDKPYMDIVNPKTTVCVGKTVQYEARVVIPPHTTAGITFSPYALDAIKVEAFSVDKNVGDFLNTRRGSSTRTTGSTDEVVDLDNPELEPGPHAAYFSFKAKKAGRTTLYFEGIARGQYVSFEVPVRVIDCKYKVVTTSQMSACYPGGCIKFLGVILRGRVTADETGHIFAGTAPVVWLSTSQVPNCGAVNSLGISKVNMRGTLNESGQLLLELGYDPVTFADVVTCPGLGSGSSNLLVTASPLKVTVRSATGVMVNLNQQLNGGPGSAPGSANVYVVPVEGAR